MTWCTKATAAFRDVPLASAGRGGGPAGDAWGVSAGGEDAGGVVPAGAAASNGSGAGGASEHPVASTSTAASAAYRLRRVSESSTDFPR